MNTDLISRSDAKALFRTARSKLNPSDYKTADEFNTRDLMLLNAEQMIHLLPSVNPMPCVDAISRQASIAALKKHFSDGNGIDTECGAYWHHGHVIDVLQGMPSVTPMTKWIFVKLYETTDPDREPVGYSPEYIFDNVMPHDGQDILITVYDEKGRPAVKQDVCVIDDGEYYIESGEYDWFDGVVAWMPLPDPAESEEQA